MPNCPIVCHLETGKSFRVTRAQAEKMLRESRAERIDGKNISLKPRHSIRQPGTMTPQRGLSAKVGAPLAEAVQDGERWAHTMVEEIRRPAYRRSHRSRRTTRPTGHGLANDYRRIGGLYECDERT